MSGIAGIELPERYNDVKCMLEKIAHRGVVTEIIETP